MEVERPVYRSIRRIPANEWRHACAILRQDFAAEYKDICDVLTRFRLKKSHIAVGGGRKSKVSEWIDSELTKKGWVEKNFQTSIKVDDTVTESPTHSVDCLALSESLWVKRGKTSFPKSA